MPREVVVQPEATIQHPAFASTAEHPASSGGAEVHLGLSVGWNKVGWVQVHMVPHEADTTGDWHIVDLDRGSINLLIRTLRKARDAAYGADA